MVPTDPPDNLAKVREGYDRWSEDFAEFTSRHPGALFGLGSGESCAGLHHPDYDFPHELIPHGVRLWQALLTETENWKP